MLFTSFLAAAVAVLPAVSATPFYPRSVATTPKVIKLGPSFPVAIENLGPAFEPALQTDAAAEHIFCDLTPAKLCPVTYALDAYNYLKNEAGSSNCSLIANLGQASTGVQLARNGTASVILTSKKAGNVTLPCATAASYLHDLIDACTVKKRVKGAIQIPAKAYTASFGKDNTVLSIQVQLKGSGL